MTRKSSKAANGGAARVETMKTYREEQRDRYIALKAAGKCVTCAISKVVKGRVRCYGCQQKQKRYDTLHRIKFLPPASKLSNDELYRRAKSERELTSWAWRNPA